MLNDEVFALRSRMAERINDVTSDNRRLFRENQVLSSIGQIISSSACIDEIYERFSEQVRILVPFDRMSINLFSAEDDAFTIAYTTGVDIDGRTIGNAFPAKVSTSGEAARRKLGLIVQAASLREIEQSYPALVPLVNAGLHSFLYVPMITREQFIGSINLGACVPGFYTEEHIKLVERVSSPIAGAISIVQLYEEQAQLQEQLYHAQKMEAIGSLAGGVAHDFNNLLTPIIGYAQMGMNSCPSSDHIRGHFQRIYAASESAAELVRQLLTFSRKEIIQPKPMSLSKIIAGMDSILHRLIGENIQLITRPKSELRLAKMDRGQMEQVLVNLVVNARDAMPDGGRIIIETDDADVGEDSNSRHTKIPPGQYVRMSVGDNGTGITDDVKVRMFDPFFTTKDIGMGTGLGLSVCYGIIKQIKGHIFVDSEPGQGTTFTIYLPADDQVHDEESDVILTAKESIPLRTGTETLLVVEDDLAVREIAAYVLREQGYTVLEAASGTEALQLFKERNRSGIDLLLTDVVLPGIGGKELSDAVLDYSADCKVIYCSGYADDTVVKHGVPEDEVAFLQKPFRPHELLRKVREVLDRQ